MKSKEEIEKWMRDEVTNPLIGDLIMRMAEDGIPMDEILETIKPLVDNTPNVERKLVEKYMRDERIKDGERLLSTIKLK
jgi:phage terminase large subunit-like protein